MTNAILVLNAGSSSLKFEVYPDAAGTPAPILRGKITGKGNAAVFSARDAKGDAMHRGDLMACDPATGHDDLIHALLDWLKPHQGGIAITAAGHRVVHGGRNLAAPALVTDALLGELDALTPLAPMHQPHNLAAIRIVATALPGLPQVACLDTSFHRTQTRLAQLFACPAR